MKNWTWVCNDCLSSEFTSNVREQDLGNLSCTRCGGDEFHKEEKEEESK